VRCVRQGVIEVNPADDQQCPVPGCTARVRSPQQLMCRVHWFAVPVEIRSRVWSAWRRWRRDFMEREALKDYKSARNAAISAASGKAPDAVAAFAAPADVGREVQFTIGIRTP